MSLLYPPGFVNSMYIQQTRSTGNHNSFCNYKPNQMETSKIREGGGEKNGHKKKNDREREEDLGYDRVHIRASEFFK
jgi:hypothetical protein